MGHLANETLTRYADGQPLFVVRESWQMTAHHDQRARFDRAQGISAVVLLGLAVYLGVLVATGTINNYMNQRFQWLVVLASVLFALMGVWRVWEWARPHDHDAHAHHDHDHARLNWWSIGLIATPLVLGVVVPSRPLGAEAVNGGVSFSTVGVGNAATFSRPPLERNILDWLREFNRVGNPASFNNLEVDVVGFVYREPDMPENQFMVARFTMSCCVADAFAIGMPVTLENASAFATGTWVRIRGVLQAGMFGHHSIPIIHPTSVDPVDVPETPYLYG